MAPGCLFMLSRKKFAWNRCSSLVGRSGGFIFFVQDLGGYDLEFIQIHVRTSMSSRCDEFLVCNSAWDSNLRFALSSSSIFKNRHLPRYLGTTNT